MTNPTFEASSNSTALRAFRDSGAPDGSTDYTTIVIAHGFGWHSGCFKKLLPLAAERNTRIVLVNRRDYPGSDPFSSDELAAIARAGVPNDTGAAAQTEAFMRDRARELYDFLADFVRRERIPLPHENTGGLIVVGWSLGCTFITALLANVALFPENDVRLSRYVRRVILYDASYVCYGYAPPPNWYSPLFDMSLSDEERVYRFSEWVTGYYAHGNFWADGGAALEFRTALAEPAPTLTRVTPAELAEVTHLPPQAKTGSESLIARACTTHGTYGVLREGTLYPREPVEGASNWGDVPVVHLWCDRSVWEMPWGTKLLAEELGEAKKMGKAVRDIVLVRFKGANHFAHWDIPEKTLEAFLSDAAEIN